MKRIISILFILLLFTACSKEEVKVDYTYEIQSKQVDMSAYKGVSSTDHKFRIIKTQELFNTIDKGSSGVFYLGRTNCGCCQNICRYINEVAKELDVTVYYIDVYNEDDTLTEKETQDKLFNYLEPILGRDEEGNKVLLTPHLFSVINGDLGKNQICTDNIQFDSDPTEKQVEKLKSIYREIMQPFVQ